MGGIGHRRVEMEGTEAFEDFFYEKGEEKGREAAGDQGVCDQS